MSDSIKDFDFDELLSLIGDASEAAEQTKDKDIALLFGKTGSGKTTLVYLLTGKNFIHKTIEEEFVIQGISIPQSKEVYDIDPADQIKGFTIGHKKESETHVINTVVEPTNKMVLCDSPGTEDTHGVIVDIANVVGIKKALDNARSVRLVVVVSLFTVQEGRGTAFMNVIDTISGLVKDFTDPKLLRSITILFSHTDSNISPTEAYEDLVRNIFASMICPAVQSRSEIVGFLLAIHQSLNRKKEGKPDPPDTIIADIIRLPPGPGTHEKFSNMIYSREPITDPANVFTYTLPAMTKVLLENKLLEIRERIRFFIENRKFESLAKLLDSLLLLHQHLQTESMDSIVDEGKKSCTYYFKALSKKLKGYIKDCLEEGGILEAKHFSEAVNEVFECWRLLNRHFTDHSESVKSLKRFIEVTVREHLEELSTPGRNFLELQTRMDKFRTLSEEVNIGLHCLTDIYDEAQRILCKLVLDKASYAKELLSKSEYSEAASVADEFLIAQECEIQIYIPSNIDFNIDKQLELIDVLFRKSLEDLQRDILEVLSGQQMPPESELAKLREKWVRLRDCVLSEAVARHAGEELVTQLYETLKLQMTSFVNSVNIFADGNINQNTAEILAFLKKLTILQDFDPQVKEQLAKSRAQILSGMTEKVLKKRSALKNILKNQLTDQPVPNPSEVSESISKLFQGVSRMQPLDRWFFESLCTMTYIDMVKKLQNAADRFKKSFIFESRNRNLARAEVFLSNVAILLDVQEPFWEYDQTEMDKRSKAVCARWSEQSLQIKKEVQAQVLDMFKMETSVKSLLEKKSWRTIEGYLETFKPFQSNLFANGEAQNGINKIKTLLKDEFVAKIEVECTQLLASKPTDWPKLSEQMDLLVRLSRFPHCNDVSKASHTLTDLGGDLNDKLQAFLVEMQGFLFQGKFTEFEGQRVSLLQVSTLRQHLGATTTLLTKAADLDKEYQARMAECYDPTHFRASLTNCSWSIIDNALNGLKRGTDTLTQYKTRVTELRHHLAQLEGTIGTQIYGLFVTDVVDVQNLHSEWKKFEGARCLEGHLGSYSVNEVLEQLNRYLITKVTDVCAEMCGSLERSDYSTAEKTRKKLQDAQSLLQFISPEVSQVIRDEGKRGDAILETLVTNISKHTCFSKVKILEALDEAVSVTVPGANGFHFSNIRTKIQQNLREHYLTSHSQIMQRIANKDFNAAKEQFNTLQHELQIVDPNHQLVLDFDIAQTKLRIDKEVESHLMSYKSAKSVDQFNQVHSSLTENVLPYDSTEKIRESIVQRLHGSMAKVRSGYATKSFEVLGEELDYLLHFSQSKLPNILHVQPDPKETLEHYVRCLQDDAKRLVKSVTEDINTEKTAATDESYLALLEMLKLRSTAADFSLNFEAVCSAARTTVLSWSEIVDQNLVIWDSPLPLSYRPEILADTLTTWKLKKRLLDTMFPDPGKSGIPTCSQKLKSIRDKLESKVFVTLVEHLQENKFEVAASILCLLKALSSSLSTHTEIDLTKLQKKAFRLVRDARYMIRDRALTRWEDNNLACFAQDVRILQDSDLALDCVPSFNPVGEGIVDGILSRVSKKIGEEKTEAIKESDPTAISEKIVALKQYSSEVPALVDVIHENINDILNHNINNKGMTQVFQIGLNLNQRGVLGLEVLDDFPQLSAVAVENWNKATSSGRLDIEGALKRLTGASLHDKSWYDPLDMRTLITGDPVDNLRKAWKKFLEVNEVLITTHILKARDTEKIEDRALALAAETRKIAKTPGTLINNWSSLQEHIPIVVAHVFALWTLVTSGKMWREVKKPEVLRVPHCIQVLSIFRLLSVDCCDKTWLGFDNKRLSNHLIEIGTGEGKSVTLGVLSIVLALFGYKPCCVCYSDYLSNRDYSAFSDLFNYLGVEKQIIYSTFENLCNRIVNDTGDIRDFSSKLVRADSTVGVKPDPWFEKDKCILLIDEVDVFFSKKFYGTTYNPGTSIQSPSITAFVEWLWANSKGMTVTKAIQSKEFQTMLTEFPGCADLLNHAVQCMVSHMATYYLPPYTVDKAQDAIGYKRHDGVAFNLSFGYRTMFAYMKERDEGKITKEAANEKIALSFACGSFSFAFIPDRFARILGVTGTLKDLSEFEKGVVRDRYSILKDTYTPSVYGERKCSFRAADDTIVEDDKELWMRAIKEKIVEETNEGRAVLVFFKSDKVVKEFKATPYGKGYDKLNDLVETTPNKDFYIKKATTSRQVTLLSKTFGRGIDFYCRDEVVLRACGVHVIQTFLSKSKSEEIQIRGRTARQGQKGSYSLILNVPDLEKLGATKEKIEEERKGRDTYLYLDSVREAFSKEKVGSRLKSIQKAEEKHSKSMALQQKLVTAGVPTLCQNPKMRTDALAELLALQVSPTGETNTTLLHTIFIIDTSGSMAAQDARPTKVHLQRQNNRVGAVLEAVENYIERRKQANPQDLYSLIEFADTVKFSIEAQAVTSFQPNLLTRVSAGGGTEFDPPLLAAQQLLSKHVPVHHTPFIFFLSDGGGACNNGLAIITSLKSTYRNFRLDALIFGTDVSGELILTQLANAGGGNLVKTAASLQELEQVMGVMDLSF